MYMNIKCRLCFEPLHFIQDPLIQRGKCKNESCTMYDVYQVGIMNTELVVDGSSGDPELESIVAEALREYFELWKQKQRSYGPHNIGSFGAAGCLIRANDKIQRLRRHYFLGKDVSLADENLEDTWKDLMGYALMGLVCHRKQWPGLES